MARQGGPIVIAIINMKGGVGKSTIAALLSRYASRERNLNVLAVDLDPQANLSQAFMGGNYVNFLNQQRPSIVEIFNGYQPPRGGRAPRPLLPQDPLLKNLLTVLVARWGYETVRRQLERIATQDDLTGSIGSKKKLNKRPSAYEYVNKKDGLPNAQRGLLLEIALRFDHKRFLPSIADVRGFLDARDTRDRKFVARDAAIPVIFQKLLTLSEEQLRAILDDQNYAGPARLGPLSAAIKAHRN